MKETDGHCWRDPRPDSGARVTLREHMRARKDLVETRVVIPGAFGLIRDIDSPISLRFLERFTSAERAAWVSEEHLAAWLVANAYSGRKTAAELYRRLRDAPAGSAGDGEAGGAVVLALVAVHSTVRAQIDDLTARMAGQLEVHPDAAIFTSLPCVTVVRAATLLAEIGDCRERFPDPESLAALAGVAPSTRASAHPRVLTFH